MQVNAEHKPKILLTKENTCVFAAFLLKRVDFGQIRCIYAGITQPLSIARQIACANGELDQENQGRVKIGGVSKLSANLLAICVSCRSLLFRKIKLTGRSYVPIL